MLLLLLMLLLLCLQYGVFSQYMVSSMNVAKTCKDVFAPLLTSGLPFADLVLQLTFSLNCQELRNLRLQVPFQLAFGLFLTPDLLYAKV